MMKIKRTVAICGTFLFLSAIFMVYLTMDLKVFPSRKKSSIIQEFQDNKWLHFEDRLKQLEEGFSKHHDEVGEIKSALKLMVPSPGTNSSTEHIAISQNIIRKSIDNVCHLQLEQPSNVDVQMLDMYRSLKFDNPDGGVWKQGWKIEFNENSWNKQHKLKVFVVPHSHNDPGWVKTFKQYYQTQTKKILNNMVEKLGEDVRRKFIWAEISFFSMWYEEQSEEVRQTVKKYIKNNQLEFVTGGWVMNDEANSHWISTVHQLTEGHQWLYKNLNFTPQSGWSIDPFGMSATQAMILKETGFKHMLIQRIHYSVKKQLAMDKSLEFRWRQFWDGAGKTDMFTHMMPFYSYDVPHTCGPDPKICCQFDFKRLPGNGVYCPWKVPPQAITDQNIARRAEMLLDQYRKKSQLYKTNVVLIPLGDDFRYDHPTEWDLQYNNYQKLFDYMNSNRHLYVQAQFGTLSDYFKAVLQEKSIDKFPTLSGDFFTYADRDDHYWSGYYTSRPYYKRMDRVLLHYIRAAEIILTQTHMSRKTGHKWLLDREIGITGLLDSARQSLALFQHHDGITGTAADFVVEDYAKILYKALQNTHNIIQLCANMLLNGPDADVQNTDNIHYQIDDVRYSHHALEDRHTITIGPEISTKNVVLYNSLTYTRTEVVVFYVSTAFVEVLDSNGKRIDCQVSPVFSHAAMMLTTKFQVAFVAKVPALGLVTYVIHAVYESEVPSETVYSDVKILNHNIDVAVPPGFVNVHVSPTASDFSIQNNKLTASFNKQGLLKAVKIGPHIIPVHLDFAKYGVKESKEKSGAYLFLPDGQARPLQVQSTTVKIVQGPIYSSVMVQLPFVEHTVTLFNTEGADSLGLEIQNVVDITKTSNFELAMRLSTNINSSEEFFTDLNGYQILRRNRFQKLPIQANYYPMPTTLYIEDKDTRLTVLTSSPIGCSSLKPGQIEMMMDRRLNQDDNRGLGQGVIDNLPTRHTFKVLFEKRLAKCHTTGDTHPAGFNTLAAHLSSQILLNPLVKLLQVKDESTTMQSEYSPGVKEPGVDINLASLKTNIIVGDKDYIGVIINRNNIDVCFMGETQLKTFKLSSGTVNLKDLLPSQYSKVSTSTLTFSNIKETKDLKDDISICLMDLNAFLLH